MKLTKKKTAKKHDVQSTYSQIGNLRKRLHVKFHGQPERLNELAAKADAIV